MLEAAMAIMGIMVGFVIAVVYGHRDNDPLNRRRCPSNHAGYDCWGWERHPRYHWHYFGDSGSGVYPTMWTHT